MINNCVTLSLNTSFISFLWVCIVMHPFLQTNVLRCGVAPVGGTSLRWEGKLQGLSTLFRSGFARSVAVGDHQSTAFLWCSWAGRVAVCLFDTWRVSAWVADVVILKLSQIPGGDAAALDVWCLAVGVAIFFINVLSQFPPLPLFQHLGLHLGDSWRAKSI